tara:strand:+ start:2504 stop:2782 length:279 start_codon:yes stop_codon:yes gene_type:complete
MIAEELEEGLKACPVPQYMHAPLRRYVIDHLAVGHFLTAVLSNNLEQAVTRADGQNSKALENWVRLVYNFLPAKCSGSPHAVSEWLKESEQK